MGGIGTALLGVLEILFGRTGVCLRKRCNGGVYEGE